MNANSAWGQDETFKKRTYGTGRRVLVPPGVLLCKYYSTRNHVKGKHLCVQYHFLLRWQRRPFEAHVALLTAQLRYHQEIVWLQRTRQQRQLKEIRRLWCREWLGPLTGTQASTVSSATVQWTYNERSQLTMNDLVTTDLRMGRITTAQWMNRLVR